MHKVFLGAAMVLAACAPTPTGVSDNTLNLAGSEWGIEAGGDLPFIQFTAEGKATGNGGCNRFSGTFSQAGQSLSFGPIMSTKMACLELQNETVFFEKLNRTHSFEGDHLKITLKSESGEAILTLIRRDWD